MKTWIFQANPTRFNIDAWLASNPVHTEWTVSRYADQITPGDHVYLWRSISGDKSRAGVFADATVVSDVRPIADDGPPEFWSDPADVGAIKPRVRIVLGRVAKPREVIKRDYWLADPLLKDHLLMKMANHTTFAIEGDQQDRLDRLWVRTGQDWSYEESLAGLYVYAETLEGEISKLPGSPVAETALLIGRPVSGMYNKVMNFRALDPSDPRKGFDGASDEDKGVWARFWLEGQGLDKAAVRDEFRRLWKPGKAIDEAAARAIVDAQAERLASSLTLADLLARWRARGPGRSKKPPVSTSASRYYERDPIVCAIARKRSDYQCEMPGCETPLFEDRNGVRFVEVHHIHRLADGGPDVPENVVCLCPNHHRQAHYGKDAGAIVVALKRVRAADGMPS